MPGLHLYFEQRLRAWIVPESSRSGSDSHRWKKCFDIESSIRRIKSLISPNFFDECLRDLFWSLHSRYNKTLSDKPLVRRSFFKTGCLQPNSLNQTFIGLWIRLFRSPDFDRRSLESSFFSSSEERSPDGLSFFDLRVSIGGVELRVSIGGVA